MAEYTIKPEFYNYGFIAYLKPAVSVGKMVDTVHSLVASVNKKYLQRKS